MSKTSSKSSCNTIESYPLGELPNSYCTFQTNFSFTLDNVAFSTFFSSSSDTVLRNFGSSIGGFTMTLLETTGLLSIMSFAVFGTPPLSRYPLITSIFVPIFIFALIVNRYCPPAKYAYESFCFGNLYVTIDFSLSITGAIFTTSPFSFTNFVSKTSKISSKSSCITISCFDSISNPKL